MEDKHWLAIAESEHFVYRAEAERPWPPAKVLELLEACYREYYDIMGPALKTSIEVEDRLCPPGKRSARRINGQIICEFPEDFGKTQEDQELAYHYFAHEVFHHWVGGYTVSHGDAVEAITQYMANRTLAKLGWFHSDRWTSCRMPWVLTRGLEKRRLNSSPVNRYYLCFNDLEMEKGEATLYELCRELAQCFRALFPTSEKADVASILSRYLSLV